MKLRPRLLLALGTSGMAILGGTALAAKYFAEKYLEESLRSQLASRLEGGGESLCTQAIARSEFGHDFPGPTDGVDARGHERDTREENLENPRPPEARRGRGPGRQGRPGGPLIFYSKVFEPLRAPQPALPTTVKEKLERGAEIAFAEVETPRGERGRRGIEGPPASRSMLLAVVPTGFAESACAYAGTLVPELPSFGPARLIGALSLGFLAALAGALYLAAASPVARIRALASHVRESAAQRYATSVPVTGNDEIADLSRAFNEASSAVRSHVDTVEKREKTLRDFVAHTHHDVSLPLTVLAGQLTTLREHIERGEPVTRESLAGAVRETQYIGSLLHNLGAAARLESESGLADMRPVDLGALVERVALRHSELARTSSIELNHAIPSEEVRVLGDITLIEQAVNNLVHNAIRYNCRGGHVALVLDTEGGEFRLTVEDDGPGVAENELGRLGEDRFRSADARSRQPEGTGLGIAIARDVAKRHSFDLTFRAASPESGDKSGLVATLSGKTIA